MNLRSNHEVASDREARNNITGGVRTAAAIVIVRRLSLLVLLVS